LRYNSNSWKFSHFFRPKGINTTLFYFSHFIQAKAHQHPAHVCLESQIDAILKQGYITLIHSAIQGVSIVHML
jgi:hypothetical protein